MKTAIALLLMIIPCNAAADCLKDCTVSDAGVNLTQHFEGYAPFVYDDVGQKKTIGFGHLLLPGERFEEPLLPDEADKLLRSDLSVAENGVNRGVSIPLHQCQFDALTDFTFNLGSGDARILDPAQASECRPSCRSARTVQTLRLRGRPEGQGARPAAESRGQFVRFTEGVI